MSKILVTVFHSMRPRFESELVPGDVFREVGHINIPQESFKSDIIHLDELYANTQNISAGWPSHRTVTTHLAECRSTSVGDVMQVGEAFYVVADRGFDKLLEFPKILRTFYDCPSFPSFDDENIQVPVFDTLMEAMHDICDNMVNAQEAYVYRQGKLVDRIEYDRMKMESKVTARLVKMRQTLGLIGITKEFTELKMALAAVMDDPEIQRLAAGANAAFYEFEDALSYNNQGGGRSNEYENARCEYSETMIERLAVASGMDAHTMGHTSVPYDVIERELDDVCQIINMHHLTMGEYIMPSQVG